jgi:hypothetical protein
MAGPGGLWASARHRRERHDDVCMGGGPDECHRRSPGRIPAAKPREPEVRALSGSDRPWPRDAAAHRCARRGVGGCQRDEGHEIPDHHRAQVLMDPAQRCAERGPVPQVRREGQRYRCHGPLSGFAACRAVAEWRRAATGSSVAGPLRVPRWASRPGLLPPAPRPESGVRQTGSSAGLAAAPRTVAARDHTCAPQGESLSIQAQ